MNDDKMLHLSNLQITSLFRQIFWARFDNDGHKL